MSTLLVIIVALVLFGGASVIVTMTKKNQYIVAIAALAICIGGILIYGAGYASQGIGFFMAVFKATSSTLKMFTGSNSISDIKDQPIMQVPGVELIFIILHFIALLISARVIVFAFGSNAIRQLRAMMIKKGELVIIYGVNDDTISFGTELGRSKNRSIVYVTKDADVRYEEIITKRVDGFLYSESYAVNPSSKFLKKIGAYKKGRKIFVYALCDNSTENLDYICKLDALLKQEKAIPKANITLTFLVDMELGYGERFLAREDETYGFGSVMNIEKEYLVARQLVNQFPPCNYVDFDNAKCVATSNFHAVIIGFGKLGQAILKEIVKHGQFEGSKFHVTIIQPGYEKISGRILTNSASMFDNYNIEFVDLDIQSKAVFDIIANDKSISYIASCIEDSALNNRVVYDIQAILKRSNIDAPVFQCGYSGISYCDKVYPIFTRETLDISLADSKAMALNHIYCCSNIEEDSSDALEWWMRASYMDKMSSRASADFSQAFIRIMGTSASQIIRFGKLDVSDTQLENLSKTEHLRWCAFYYTMGYIKMPDEAFAQKCEDYRDEISKYSKSKIKIQKDDDRHYHICLVDWDELDNISKIYGEVMNRNKDYKLDDTNNVLMLPTLLKLSQ